ncbi:hypothetical protein ABIA32_002898 [Streptacidiphilus sp. MAP12-20]|uniref:helix-turn-helix transcriptional regulator n=1 Tax=Streptacidiphilus sp. MAP12-20 TaxID=3156299 RepID=UPI0035193F31
MAEEGFLRTEGLIPLGDHARALYSHVLKHGDPSVPRAELSRATGLDPAQLDEALEQLRTLRLVGDEALLLGEVLPIAPATARMQLLSPLERDLERKQRAVDAVRAVYAQLALPYQQSMVRSAGEGAVTEFHDLSGVRKLITELSATCSEEVIAAHPGGARSEEVLRESQQRTEQLLARGVRMRSLYQHTARHHPPTAAYVAFATALGAEVRTQGDAFMRLLLFDCEAAIVELRGEPLGALLIREPSIVQHMKLSFESNWSRARAFDPAYDSEVVREISGSTKLTIMRLLVEGIEDKAVARRLGMSLRTCQRHIAEILRSLGARNRLQAGYLIHRYGLGGEAGPTGVPSDTDPSPDIM